MTKVKFIKQLFVSEYTAWLEDIERKTSTSYFTRRSKTLSDGSRKSILICNRSGDFKSKGEGKRQMKSQGSCRMGKYCPAEIILLEHNDEYKVMYRPNHLGHDFILGHVKTPASIRSQIAGMDFSLNLTNFNSSG